MTGLEAVFLVAIGAAITCLILAFAAAVAGWIWGE